MDAGSGRSSKVRQPFFAFGIRYPALPTGSGAGADIRRSPDGAGPNGLVISEDMTNRFLSVIPPGPDPSRAMCMPWILGIRRCTSNSCSPVRRPGERSRIMAVMPARRGRLDIPAAAARGHAASPISGPSKSVGGTDGEAMVRVPERGGAAGDIAQPAPAGPRGQPFAIPWRWAAWYWRRLLLLVLRPTGGWSSGAVHLLVPGGGRTQGWPSPAAGVTELRRSGRFPPSRRWTNRPARRSGNSRFL